MEIISNITGFITYFVPGYIYISCFNYTACRSREPEIKYLIIKSIAISYLFYVIISSIGNYFNIELLVVQLITFIFASIVGLILGRLSRTKCINKISLSLFKREIENNLFVNLWEEANKKECVIHVEITMKDCNLIYKGQIFKVSSYNDDPEITLIYYTCLDSNNNLISDNSNFDDKGMVIYYSNIKFFSYELI